MLLWAVDTGDKTEEPTLHRLREARRKGQVFKSMELNAAISILGIMLLLLLAGQMAFGRMESLFYLFMEKLPAHPLDETGLRGIAGEAAAQYLRIVGPVFLAALLLGVTVNLAQVGFLISPSQLAPQLNRLNPLEGFKRIVSKRAIFDMVKAILKIMIIGGVTYLFIRSKLADLLLLINQEAAISARVFWETMTGLGLRVGLAFLLLALMDYLFQRQEFKRSMRMSRTEIKEEHKHLEGDPLIRSKIREKQRYLARRRMLQEVPKADVVITNPTEIAIALQYREGRDSAPRVVAKGVEILARRIREIAAEHKIMIVQNPPLAQMLWKDTDIGEEISFELYQAIAEILAMVFRMRDRSNL